MQNPYPPEDFSFSKPLKLRLVEYFRKEYDLDIKDEEADLFLNSLAALYDALSRAAPQSEPLKRPDAGGSEVGGSITPTSGQNPETYD